MSSMSGRPYLIDPYGAGFPASPFISIFAIERLRVGRSSLKCTYFKLCHMGTAKTRFFVVNGHKRPNRKVKV
jgi:hypothetical protein